MRLESAAGRKSLGAIRIANPTFWLACAVLALVLIGSEALARTNLARRWLVTPSVGTNHEQFNVKLELLQQFAQDGPVDCILFGNSVMAQGVDPAILGAAFQERTGRRLRCFNFGIDAATTRTIDAIAAIVTSQYHPPVVVFSTTPYDFVGGLLPRALSRTAWFEYRMGKFTWRGWLTDHSAAYRYLLSHRSWITPTYWERLRRTQLMRNFTRSDGFRELHGSKRRPRRRVCNHQQQAILNHARAGVRSYGRLRRPGINVLAIEVPFQASMHPCYRDSDRYNELFDGVAAAARRAGIRYWRTPPAVDLVPANGWWDMGHMNADGAAVFSRWLAAQLAAEPDVGVKLGA